MDGEPGVTHNGVRADDAVDPFPRLSASLLPNKARGELERLVIFISVDMTKQRS
jgi:hypothetical protein